MQGPKYKFEILNIEDRYYYVDELNSVQLSNFPFPIKNPPTSWQEITVGIYSNDKYKGSFSKASTPQNFVLDAKRIIDYIAIYEGSSAYARFVIKIQNPDDFSYDDFFDGTLDFKSWKQYETESTINIRQTRLLDILEAKEDLEIEIPLTNENSVEFEHDGIDLTYRDLYGVNDGFGTTSGWNLGRHAVELIEASNENPYSSDTVRTKFTNLNASLYNTVPSFYKGVVPATVKVDYNFSVLARWADGAIAPNPTFQMRYNVFIIQANGNVVNTGANVIYFRQGSANVFGVSYLSGKVHTIQGSITLNAIPGDRIFFVNSSSPIGGGGGEAAAEFTYQLSPSEFIVTTLQRMPTTLHLGIRPIQLFKEIITKITNGKYTGESNLLANDTRQILIPATSLRKKQNPTVKTTIKKFLTYAYVQKLGILKEVNNTAVIEHIEKKYLQKVGLDLGEVKNLENGFSKTKNICTIKTGYENLDLGFFQANGLDEYNQTNNFSTGMLDASNGDNKAEYNIVCPYHAGIYPIEELRTNFSKRATTDNSKDGDLFLIDSAIKYTARYYSGNFSYNSGYPGFVFIGNIPHRPIGSQVTLTGTGLIDGIYTITNYITIIVGVTIMQVSTPVAAGNFIGTFTYTSLTPIYYPRRNPVAILSNCLSPSTAYNYEITPKDLLKLHMRIIIGGIYNVSGDPQKLIIKFESGDKGDKNVLFQKAYGLNVVKENADEDISYYPLPFYLPIEGSFETDYIKNIYKKIDEGLKYEQIRFKCKGEVFFAYLEDCTTNPDDGRPLRWNITYSATTDIVKLLQ